MREGTCDDDHHSIVCCSFLLFYPSKNVGKNIYFNHPSISGMRVSLKHIVDLYQMQLLFNHVKRLLYSNF